MFRFIQTRILYKGLALVLVPLSIATLCFLLLGHLWRTSETLANEEAHQRDFAMGLSLATEARHVVILELMSRMFDPNQPWEQFANRKHQDLLVSYQLLKKGSEDDPNRLQVIDEIEKMSEHEWSVLSKLPKAQADSTMLDNLGACRNMSGLLQLGVDDGAAISELAQKEATACLSARTNEQKAREKFKAVAYAVLAACFVVAPLGLFLFNRDITSRLNLLVFNSRRLPLRQPLGLAVAGNDELAYLDSMLHEASEQLSAADEHRRSVMEMVAHDMRSPLMAAQVSTEILNHPSAEKLPADTAQLLESVRKNINQVLRLVNELLTNERFEAGKIELELSKFNIEEAVNDAISAYLDLGNTAVAIDNNCTEQYIRADKERFEQLIVNFISTVRAFPGSASKITIECQSKPEAMIVSVSAVGPPLDRARRTDLFKKFPKYGGNNRADDLALAACNLIARCHGGAVGFEHSKDSNSLWSRWPLDATPDRDGVIGASKENIPGYFRPYKPKWYTLRLIHIWILLVAVPLGLEAVLIASLNSAMDKGESVARDTQRITDTMLNTNAALNATFDVAVTTSHYALTGNPKMKQRAEEQGAAARVIRKRVAELTRGHPRETRVLTGFDNAIMQPMELQLEIAQAPRQGILGSARVFQVFMSYARQMSTVGQMLADLAVQERWELDQMRLQQIQSNNALQSIVWRGLAANLILALALVLVLNIYITNRLKTLVTNAGRLPKREPLLKQLRGGDELAYLDFVLHRVADEIVETAAQRQGIVELLVDDMRTPLASASTILNSIEPLLLEKMPGIAPKHIVAIQGNIERILRLVDDLLTLESAEDGKLEIRVGSFEIKAAVDEAIAALASIARHREIQIANDVEPYMVSADRARVLQVLLNYLSNALKFSPSHTQITVVTRHDAHMLNIGVRDQGPGIEAKAMKQIFEKFSQGKTAQKSRGFGLGLAICKLIAEAHGGQVSVDSEPGQGSTFWLSLPLEGSRVP